MKLLPYDLMRFYLFINFSIVIFFLLLQSSLFGQEKLSVIIDADTGNEVDDYYALTAAFLENTWVITALNATQWQSSQWAIAETMENSHRLNQVLLGELNIAVPTKRGGVHRMFDWGDQAQHSAASYSIIKSAKALAPGERLTIIALGALTNVGSAIYIQPDIAEKIDLFWLGSTYDFEKDVFKKNDFNCVMDVQALEVILQSPIKLQIMPLNVASNLTFDFDETMQSLPEHRLSTLLLDRWFDHLDGGRQERVIWDLALIQAMIYPDLATTKTVQLSRDNEQKTVTFYQSIDASKMKLRFFEKVDKFCAQ